MESPNKNMLTRRSALGRLGRVAASALLPSAWPSEAAAALPSARDFSVRRPAADRRFEIAASLYPWDLADEGVERVLDHLQEKTACNTVYLVAIMHPEKRPLGDYFFPHNPVRKYYVPEDGCVFWKPDSQYYKRIKPAVVQRDTFLKDRDWLQVLIDAARKRGMKTGVELSHTLLNHERAGGELKDCIQTNADGQRLANFLCINHPDTRAYVGGLYADLLSRYDLDFLQTCQILFEGGRKHQHAAVRIAGTPQGGCFCAACREKSAAQGLDLEKTRQNLLPLFNFIEKATPEQRFRREFLEASNVNPTAMLLEYPALFPWLLFRRDSVADYFKHLHGIAKRVRPGIELRYNAHRREDGELYGDDLQAIGPYVDSFRASHYGEETGNPADLEHKRKYLLALRYAIGVDKPLLSAISIRKKTTPRLIEETMIMARKCGIDGISLGHYDCGTFTNMEAVRPALAAADIEFAEVWKK
jgi:hypothetical protein